MAGHRLGARERGGRGGSPPPIAMHLSGGGGGAVSTAGDVLQPPVSRPADPVLWSGGSEGNGGGGGGRTEALWAELTVIPERGGGLLPALVPRSGAAFVAGLGGGRPVARLCQTAESAPRPSLADQS